ncbi:NhaP-type Na+/H+ or K+/H+ antiporter [Novosphingobium chloroacetimidivorans]|uniref:NhaP-type Na+/H+ or K+/H+ antiporter n=1 Tax=Novosphingobium chloroacetimidivorans TaxID=1428314 RepID=A0A7W7NYP3_9SPHN|nr:cation:proton antiporter [Novosphingobium chloroacetimidivorans]MBB4860704.1 NhaP-type Na+/H+ or K+/H+ antiporter [Novosphingobium chloroacetimidivorans]
MWVFARLDETVLDVTVSSLAGFIAYLVGEWFHASGVLAAIACGLVLGGQQHVEFTAQSRIAIANIWGFIVFLLTALSSSSPDFNCGVLSRPSRATTSPGWRR